jgi:hypothetical protein
VAEAFRLVGEARGRNAGAAGSASSGPGSGSGSGSTTWPATAPAKDMSSLVCDFRKHTRAWVLWVKARQSGSSRHAAWQDSSPMFLSTS